MISAADFNQNGQMDSYDLTAYAGIYGNTFLYNSLSYEAGTRLSYFADTSNNYAVFYLKDSNDDATHFYKVGDVTRMDSDFDAATWVANNIGQMVESGRTYNSYSLSGPTIEDSGNGIAYVYEITLS